MYIYKLYNFKSFINIINYKIEDKNLDISIVAEEVKELEQRLKDIQNKIKKYM